MKVGGLYKIVLKDSIESFDFSKNAKLNPGTYYGLYLKPWNNLHMFFLDKNEYLIYRSEIIEEIQ
jgi:hypothetical protein